MTFMFALLLDLFDLRYEYLVFAKLVHVSKIFLLTSGMCTIPVKIFPENAYAETTYARDILTILVWLRWQHRSNERKIHAGNFLKTTGYAAASCFQRPQWGSVTLGRIVFTSCKQTGLCLIILASAQ